MNLHVANMSELPPPLFVLRGHKSAVNCVSIQQANGVSPRILSGFHNSFVRSNNSCATGEIIVWDFHSRRPLEEIPAHPAGVLEILLAEGNSHVIS